MNAQLKRSQLAEAQGDRREVVYIDPAYPLATVLERGQLNFIKSRDRGGYFDRVWGIHPFVGLTGNRWAGRIRRQWFDDKQIVLDGYAEGLRIPRLLIPLNVALALLRMLVAIVRLAHRKQVKAIYAADVFGCGLLAFVASALTGKPLLVACYVNQDENWEANRQLIAPRLLPSRQLERAVSRMILRRAAMVEVGTENLRQYAIANGADPRKIQLLPVVKFISDVHLADPQTRPNPGAFLSSRKIPEAPLYLLFVGRLKSFKFPDEAIAAMDIVLRQFPNLIGLLAGAGEMRQELLDDIAGRSLSERIFLLGDCDHPSLAALAPRCITLSPLSGMALIETSLAGSPPVVYDRDWQAEFVKDGESGFVVPFRDHRALAEKGAVLVADPDLRTRMGKQARENALNFADPLRTAVGERHAMEAILGSSGPELDRRRTVPAEDELA
jgi:glycosyltransferase involved in cell wall biosynthesis